MQNIVKIKGTVIILWLLGLSLRTAAQTPQKAHLDSLLHLSINLTISQHYDSAFSVGRQITTRFPAHPIGYLFMAATLQTQMMDYETTHREQLFESYLDTTIESAQKYLGHHPNDAWSYFYIGSAYAYRAFFESKQNRYWSALRNVRRGMPALRQAIALDSTLYDAYLGLGSYLFWRSEKTKSLNWLPFFKDERERGIRMIKMSVRKSHYSRYPAMNALVWIYLELNDYEQALQWARQGGDFFPDSRYFKWCLAETHFRLRNYIPAIDYFQQIISSLQNEKFNNHYNEIVCHLKIARCHFELKQYQAALEHCLAVEQLNLSPDIRERATSKIEHLNQLKKDCQHYLRHTSLIKAFR